ncbi:ABC transporter permease [Sphingomonas sp. NSE70-1]|uniref:Xylose transport system permease protein XylH n=1 Tax=Sphingomonas caseinilyticus TaxID=2908205 RepID=A0ABT0RXA0_9SPHN|nr:ABC transporter permease [Sphingomonas caseinilyticus]MCL6699524.1 ABC transporter permease [Sphingomonas caseinilyticus]
MGGAEEPEAQPPPAQRFLELVKRPELGAVGGLLVVTLFFLFTADPAMFTAAGLMNVMSPAAQLGILAVGAALLMISGEFDLSIGSMVAFAGFVFGAILVVWQAPLAVAILLTFAFAISIGALNAQIVLKTGLPSFIVTLALLFMLRGLSLVGLKWATGGSTQLRGIRESVTGSSLLPLFTGDVSGIPIELLWFAAVAAIGAFVLARTRFGNWILASGGDAEAARNSGVPVADVKAILFIVTACCAALVAILTVLDSGSTDARRGFQKEFEAIIAAVIGGCLLTGGFGSVVGAFFGAIIFGMVVIGLTYTRIDQDWYQVFLGAMLLMAVLFNNYVRKRVAGERS